MSEEVQDYVGLYTLRVNEGGTANPDTVNNWHVRLGAAYLLVHETNAEGNNPHYHSIIYSRTKIGSVRENFRRNFPDRIGNKRYALELCNDEWGYIKYILKGPSKWNGEGDFYDWVKVVGHYGIGKQFTKEGQIDLHYEYWTLYEASQKEREQKRKERSKNFREKVLQECKDLKEKTYRNVVEVIMDAHEEAQKACDLYSIRRMANGIMLTIDPRFKRVFTDLVMSEGVGYAFDELLKNRKVKVGDIYREDIDI